MAIYGVQVLFTYPLGMKASNENKAKQTISQGARAIYQEPGNPVLLADTPYPLDANDGTIVSEWPNGEVGRRGLCCWRAKVAHTAPLSVWGFQAPDWHTHIHRSNITAQVIWSLFSGRSSYTRKASGLST